MADRTYSTGEAMAMLAEQTDLKGWRPRPANLDEWRQMLAYRERVMMQKAHQIAVGPEPYGDASRERWRKQRWLPYLRAYFRWIEAKRKVAELEAAA